MTLVSRLFSAFRRPSSGDAGHERVVETLVNSDQTLDQYEVRLQRLEIERRLRGGGLKGVTDT